MSAADPPTYEEAIDEAAEVLAQIIIRIEIDRLRAEAAQRSQAA